jgi:predicted deacylase
MAQVCNSFDIALNFANILLVIALPTVNPMGIYLNQRNYYTSGASGSLTNVNRVFPGTSAAEGGSGPQLLAYNIWNYVWGNASQVDVGIDLRTFS